MHTVYQLGPKAGEMRGSTKAPSIDDAIEIAPKRATGTAADVSDGEYM